MVRTFLTRHIDTFSIVQALQMLKYLDMPWSEWLPQEPTEIASTCGISHKKSGILGIVFN